MSLTVIIGKTASGKSLAGKILEERGYEKIITYTTRPARKKEKDGVDYNFVSDEKFKKMIDNGEFFEYKKYDVATGETWYYGTVLPKDLEEKDYIIILTPSGLEDIRKAGIKHKSVYITANAESILGRLTLRGDDQHEAARRMKHDYIDFEGVKADFCVANCFGGNIETVCDEIEVIINGN